MSLVCVKCKNNTDDKQCRHLYPHDLDCCLFCFKCRSNLPDPSSRATDCSYGLGHEFLTSVVVQRPVPIKKDNKLCINCGLHPNNPNSKTNNCQHQYLGYSNE